MNLVLNVLLFQIGWFACVLGAANGLAWAGAAVAAAIVGWHIARATRPTRELALVAVAALAGAAFETMLVHTGWVHFDSGMVLQGFAPYWMVALWALFATTLNVSLRWLRGRPALSAVLGGVGGPAAYYAGSQLGAIELVAAGMALAAIGAGWAVLAPALLGAARRLDGYAQP